MRRISKRFPGVVALKDVDLDVRQGEVLGLIGENGAGKSTVMKILSGAYRADSGTIEVGGETVEDPTPQRMHELGVSMIYQDDAGAASDGGREPLPRPSAAHAAWLRRLEGDGAKERRGHGAARIPRRPACKARQDQRQMVEISGALSRNARLVVLDEPSAVLGGAELETLFNVIRQLAAEGVSFIYISHRLGEVFAVCDRVTVLRDGAAVGTRAVSEVGPDDLIRMMVGRRLEDIYPARTRREGREVLAVRGLSRAGVLDDIDLDVRAGEILGICGMAGSGRTEMLRALIGADPASCRSWRLRGREEKPANPRAAVAAGIVLLPEDRKTEGCFLLQSVAFNITVSRLGELRRTLFLSEGVEREVVEGLVRRLGIRTPGIGARIANLSGGNQQKCLIARSLHAHASILLIDEPTRGVDVGAKREIYQLLATLADSGGAVVIVSSELPEILGLCDRILVMRDGRVAGRFEREEASEEALLQKAVGSGEIAWAA